MKINTDKIMLIGILSLLILMGIFLVLLYSFMIFENNYKNLLSAILNTIVFIVNAINLRYQYKIYKIYKEF